MLVICIIGLYYHFQILIIKFALKLFSLTLDTLSLTHQSIFILIGYTKILIKGIHPLVSLLIGSWEWILWKLSDHWIKNVPSNLLSIFK